MKKRLIYFAIYFALLIFFTMTTMQIDMQINGGHQYYFVMSKSPFALSSSPFCYRILIPLVVHVIPVDELSGYFLVTFILFTALIWLIHIYSAGLFKSEKTGFILTLFFLLIYWSSRFFIFNPYAVEPGVYIAIFSLLILMQKDNNIAFLLLFTISIFIKESVLLIAPAYLAYQLKKNNFRKACKNFLIYALPPVIIYFLFRFFAFKMHLGRDIIESVQFYVQNRGSSGFIRIFMHGILNTWGVLLVVLISELKTVIQKIREMPWTLVLFLTGLLQPLFDSGVEIMLFASFPAMLLWFQPALDGFLERFKMIYKPVVLAGLLTIHFIFNLKFHEYGVMLPEFLEDIPKFTGDYIMPALLLLAFARFLVRTIQERKMKTL